MIKLMGRTGVCLERLQTRTVQLLLTKTIRVLNHRSFIDVLLPWVSAIVREMEGGVGVGSLKISLEILS